MTEQEIANDIAAVRAEGRADTDTVPCAHRETEAEVNLLGEVTRRCLTCGLAWHVRAEGNP